MSAPLRQEPPAVYDQSLEQSPPAPARRRRPPRVAPSDYGRVARRGHGITGIAERSSWVAGIVLAVSPFMGWYTGASVEGPPLSILGWYTGTLGKLVVFAGLAVILLALFRELGVELPSALPTSLLTTGLGAVATIFVLIRVLSIPDTYAGTGDRGIGIWIGLIAGLVVTAAGLLRASEDL